MSFCCPGVLPCLQPSYSHYEKTLGLGNTSSQMASQSCVLDTHREKQMLPIGNSVNQRPWILLPFHFVLSNSPHFFGTCTEVLTAPVGRTLPVSWAVSVVCFCLMRGQSSESGAYNCLMQGGSDNDGGVQGTELYLVGLFPKNSLIMVLL